MLPINVLAVLVAAIASFVLGFLFHGPFLGRVWMKLAHIHPTGNEKFSSMVPQMIWNFVANLVTAYVLAVIYLFASSSQYVSAVDLWGGVIVAVWLWFGFLVPSSSIGVIWMKQSAKLWLFEAGCSLVVMIVMGAIIGSWQ